MQKKRKHGNSVRLFPWRERAEPRRAAKRRQAASLLVAADAAARSAASDARGRRGPGPLGVFNCGWSVKGEN